MNIATSHYPIDFRTLPESWAAVSVGEATNDIQPGFACGLHNKKKLGIPHIRPMNIDRQGRLDLSVVKYVSGDNPLRLHRGDVLFNNTNSAELIGKSTYIAADSESAFSNHMTRLRPATGIDPRFVAYQLHFAWMAGYFQHRCTHHVNQASVASSTLADTVPLVVAPFMEQERIVAEIEKQFTRLDAAVAALKRVQANLKRYRASVLKAACEGRLVPTEVELARREGRSYEPASELLKRTLADRRSRWESAQLVKLHATGGLGDERWKRKYKEPDGTDVTDLPSLPEGWTWATTAQIGEVQLGRQRSPKNRSKNYPTKYIRAANITENGIDLEDVFDMDFDPEERRRYRLRFGDVVLSEASGSARQVGKPAIWRNELEECCFQNTVIRLKPYEVLSKYLLVVFQSYYWNGLFARIAGGVGINHLGADKFSGIDIAIPPLAEQGRIVAEVERRLSVIDELDMETEADLKRADRLRQAILKRAFEGKLVPQDPNDEPASVLLERIRTERARRDETSNGNGRRKLKSPKGQLASV